MAVVVRNLDSTTAGPFFDCSAVVTLDGRPERLTFRRYGDHPRLADRHDTFDPFAVALLVPAMIRGEPLVIEGAIDDWLLGALRGPVQALLRSIAPTWRAVPVEADARPARPSTDWSPGAAAALSGGIDSLHLARHRLLDPTTPETLRVKLFVHHHVGAHGEDNAVFAEQSGHARRIAESLGVPLVGTCCSLRTAYRGRKFIHSVTMRNVAASLALDHLFAAFLYASTETLAARPAFDRRNGLSTVDPALLPLFNTTRAVWLPFGGDVTRLRKSAEVIHDDRLCHRVLVCIRGFRRDRGNLNCGQCYKCARLLLHAEADGRLDAVGTTFDLDAYRRGRSYAILRSLHWALGPDRNENDIDLLKYLHGRRFSFPTWARPAVALVIALHGRRHSIEA
jgi:hypothetical protein